MVDNLTKDLFANYEKRKLVPFIGSGVSRPLDIPTWHDMINGFAEYNNQQIDSNIQKLLQKNDYYEAIGNLLYLMQKNSKDFKQYVSSMFKEKLEMIESSPRNLKESIYPILKGMSFPIYLTTNYDNLVSYALNYHPIDIRSFNSSHRQLVENKNVVYHLHGEYHDPLNMIASREEYDDLYTFSNINYRDNLRAIISSYNLLFIGYSFDDTYFCDLLKIINKIAKNNHYILLNNPNGYITQKFKAEYNLEVIPINTTNSTYTIELTKILKQIKLGNKLEVAISKEIDQNDESNKTEIMPFIIDAADFPFNIQLLNNIIYKNFSISEFLKSESNYRCVCSSNGLGKTLLLNIKRNYMEELGYTCIPSNQEYVDRFKMDDIVINRKNEKLLDSLPQWESIWRVSIALSVLKKHFKQNDNPKKMDKQAKQSVSVGAFYSAIEELCKQNVFINKIIYSINYNKPSDIIMQIIKLDRKDFGVLFEKYLSEIISLFACIHTNYAVFIDNIDEFTKEPPDISYESDDTFVISYGRFNPKFWFYIQIGSLIAEYKLSRENSHIKVFISMRKEAYDSMDKYCSAMVDKFKSHVCFLKYTSRDLEYMLNNYLALCSRKYFINEFEDSKSYFTAFFGMSVVNHDYTNEKEEIFKYLYRHSLKRPRDIIKFCKRIVENRDKSIKAVINQVSSEILLDYLKECRKFINYHIEWEKLYSLIKKRCLSKNDLIDICSKYNDIENGDECDRTCKACKRIHIFCTLYNIGLLGVVKPNYDDNTLLQSFIGAGERHIITQGSLPKSEYYFLHPCLNNDPFRTGKDLSINGFSQIIGDGCQYNFEDNV